MTTLLHISASPRGAALGVARARGDVPRRPTASRTPTRDRRAGTCGTARCREFGPAAAAAKMDVFAGADARRADEAAAWRAARATFDRFAAADRYLFTVPMWNAGSRTSSSSSSTW